MKTIGVIVAILAVVLIGWLALRPDVADIVVQTPNQNTNNTGSNPPATQAGVPLVVTDQKAIPTDTTVVMTGTVTPNGAITSYWYEYGTTPDMGKVTTKQVLGSGFVAIPSPAYVTGLTKNTTYYFRLNAENQFGKVSNGKYSFVTTDGVSAPVGSAPRATSLGATSITRTTANLNGEVTPNQAGTQYWFEYGPTTSLGNVSALSSAGNGTLKVPVSLSLSELNPATTYYFRVNAQNQFGTVNGTILNFNTSGPPASSAPTVTTLAVNSITASTATLAGNVNPNGENTTVWFEYSTDSQFNGSSLKITEKSSAGAGTALRPVTALASPLLSKTKYYFRIVAQNSVGTTRGDTISFESKEE